MGNIDLYDVLTSQASELEAAATKLEEQAAVVRAQASGLRKLAFEQSPEASEEVRQRSCQGKARYKTAAGAGEAAKVFKARRGDDLRIYACEFCQGFHFTKKTLEQFVGAAV